jgi:hypothetical protein
LTVQEQQLPAMHHKSPHGECHIQIWPSTIPMVWLKGLRVLVQCVSVMLLP